MNEFVHSDKYWSVSALQLFGTAVSLLLLYILTPFTKDSLFCVKRLNDTWCEADDIVSFCRVIISFLFEN